MITNSRRKLAVGFVGLSALALGACASPSDVQRAQSSADAALQQATIANQTALTANQNAQAAAAAVARSSIASRP